MCLNNDVYKINNMHKCKLLFVQAVFNGTAVDVDNNTAMQQRVFWICLDKHIYGGGGESLRRTLDSIGTTTYRRHNGSQ